jgi:hypothetical protein
MNASSERRPFTFAGPILVGIIAAQRAAEHVRTVDFLLLFFGGAAFGIGCGELVRFLRARRP